MSEQDQYRTASYQGERLGLSLNWRAIDELRGVLDGLSPGSSWRSRGRVRVRLPDGRDLTLTVAATDDGAVRDEHGEWIGDDGLAHGDVTGDLARHHDAAQVIDAVTRTGHLDLPLPDEGSQEVDGGWLERRDRDVDDAVDRLAARHAYGSAADRRWVQQLRDRAERAAAATSTERLAEAQRMGEQMAAARRQRQGQTAAQSRPGVAARNVTDPQTTGATEGACDDHTDDGDDQSAAGGAGGRRAAAGRGRGPGERRGGGGGRGEGAAG